MRSWRAMDGTKLVRSSVFDKDICAIPDAKRRLPWVGERLVVVPRRSAEDTRAVGGIDPVVALAVARRDRGCGAD